MSVLSNEIKEDFESWFYQQTILSSNHITLTFFYNLPIAKQSEYYIAFFESKRYPLISHFEIMDPPTKYIHRAKQKIDPETGKLKETTYYLTYNLFFSGDVHWSQLRKIVNHSKEYLMPYFCNVPKMQKFIIEIIYHRPTEHFDLDNKLGYWLKVILDFMKTPTSKEIKKAEKYKSQIKTISVIPDDSVKFVPELKMKYKKGPHKMEIIIHGILEEKQIELF